MKLILAIVNNDASRSAAAALTDEGFFVTQLSTTCGVLMVGNTTFLIGTQDEDTQRAIGILKKTCKTRKQTNAPTASFGAGLRNMSLPNEVSVGGATIFVMDVESMEKI